MSVLCFVGRRHLMRRAPRWLWPASRMVVDRYKIELVALPFRHCHQHLVSYSLSLQKLPGVAILHHPPIFCLLPYSLCHAMDAVMSLAGQSTFLPLFCIH